MTAEKYIIKVGDIINFIKSGEVIKSQEVIKVTPKFAHTKAFKFKREISYGSKFRYVGADVYTNVAFQVKGQGTTEF